MGLLLKRFARINESDMYLYPDLDSGTVFPWGDENGSVAWFGDVYINEGEPFAETVEILNVLFVIWKKLIQIFNLGPEPEFFLFKLDENGDHLEVNDMGGYFWFGAYGSLLFG